MLLGSPVTNLFLLAIPVACIAWTVTHEEIFREPHEYCVRKSKVGRTLFTRKFFYMLTCEYCFSHYVAIGMLFLSGFRLVFNDWRGYLISGFSLVWVANIYMSLFSLLRMDIKKEKTIIKEIEEQIGEGEERSREAGGGSRET